MKYLGNFILGFNQLERRTVTPAAGFYSNGTLFRGDADDPDVIADASGVDATTLGVLMVQPDGVNIIAGDSIDLVCGTIRIDYDAYEVARKEEIEEKGSSTMADLSSLVDPAENHSITGSGCVVQLVKVVR